MRQFTGFEKGVNLGGWFSQCCHTQEHYETFIVEADLSELSTWGIDHVRIPIDYVLLEDKEGNPVESGMALLKRAAGWCRSNGLNMVLDLHRTAGYSFDDGEKESGFFENPALQERFYALWERLAAEFGNCHEWMAFELLNEVTDKAYCEKWNEVAEICVGRIRRLAPHTKILIGGYWNNSVAAVPDLPMPFDENIVYNFHCYEPLVFTHQGGYWVKNMPTDFRMEFKGNAGHYQAETERLGLEVESILKLSAPDAENAEFFRQFFAKAVQIAEERNVPLYCGEYGVISLAENTDIVKWYQAIHAALAENHIGRAAWSYRKMDFGLADADKTEILSELKQYL